MKSFANLIALPLVLGALVFLYLAWQVDSDYAPWMVPFVVLAATVYVLAPQINWWWFSRHPPELEPEVRALLERFHPFYGRLGADDRLRFRQRMALFVMGTDWQPMAFPDEVVPLDVQYALAAQAVTLTLRKPVFLFPAFEKVIVYPRPFPTPEYPFAHASELYAADGCLLFSAEQVVQAFVQPAAWYQVGLHEYAKAFALAYPNAGYPGLPDVPATWDALEAASGMPRAHVESVVGLAGIDPLPVAVHHHFTFPDGLRAHLPEAHAAFERIFS